MPFIQSCLPSITHLSYFTHRITLANPHLSQTFANVLFHLAAEPDKYLQPLRDEVEEVVAKHGWTKTAMREMYKLDSFLRESGRYNGLGCCECLFSFRSRFLNGSESRLAFKSDDHQSP